MENDKKRSTLIITLLILAVLMVAFIVWWQFFRDETADINLNNSATANDNTQSVLVNVANVNSTLNTDGEGVDDDILAVRRLASLFAERFGSYNSESNFQNAIDLKGYMTDSMKTWTDNYVASQNNSQNTGVYYAIISKVLTTKILSQNDTDTTVQLLTQRTESGDDFEQDNTFNQSIELEMKYLNDVWLVNKATWGDKK